MRVVTLVIICAHIPTQQKEGTGESIARLGHGLKRALVLKRGKKCTRMSGSFGSLLLQRRLFLNCRCAITWCFQMPACWSSAAETSFVFS